MRKLVSGLLATALAASMAFASVMPTNAAPVYVPNVAPAEAGSALPNLEQVQMRIRRGGPGVYRGRGGPGMYRGYRGYRYARPGYRNYNGWWFPAAAFITGAIIADSLATPRYRPRAYGGGNAHVEWCYNRYRSYRASDNTFQPYNGRRQQCYSPYD